jgi:hypothetical protein
MLLQHNAILKDLKPHSVVAGLWQETLTELGIPPFPDKLESKAIRELPPESHVRFDLRRRKRALALPNKSMLNVAPEAAAEESPLDKRIFLERELNIFKRLNEDHIQADRVAGRLKRKQAAQSRRSSHQTARRSSSETEKVIKLL